MKNNILIGLLSILFLADVMLLSQESTHSLRVFTKPLLVPVITAIYLLNTHKQRPINPYFLAGLIFSFLGDTFLLFKWAFLPGLGCFLVAHVLYILSFIRHKVKNSYGYLPFILLYLGLLLYFLHPYLHEMEIPVMIYGVTISTMAYFSICTRNIWLIAGAIFFVISDSLLSFNLFVSYTAVTEQIVMGTYVLAQFFLVRGMIFGKQAPQTR